MSQHSNIQSQNPQAQASHRNMPATSPAPHSQAAPAPSGPPAAPKEWVATYLDGQFYLTDPESISKLKNIEAEIERERIRLAKLQQDSLSHNNSFLSYQEDPVENRSDKSFCTEFDQSRHFTRQQEVKNDLEKEEEMYRQKLRLAERERAQAKKNVKPLQSKKEEKQVGPGTAQTPSRKQSLKKERLEQSIKKEIVEEAITPNPVTFQGEKSVKAPSRKPSQDKSYHKSRIQKSIKETLALNEEIANISPEKSVKVSVKPSENPSIKPSEKASVKPSAKPSEKQVNQAQSSSLKNSQQPINIVVFDPDHEIKANLSETPAESKSVKASVKESVKDSVKQSVKASQKHQNVLEKEPSVKAAVSVKGQEQHLKSQKSAKINNPSVKASQKLAPSQKSVKIQVQKSVKVSAQRSVKAQAQKSVKSQAQNVKSIKLQEKEQAKSIKPQSEHPVQAPLESPPKSHKSHQVQEHLEVQQPNHSQRKSIKPSEKSYKAESIRAPSKHSTAKEIQKLAQIISQNPAKLSEKAPSLHQEPQKSMKAASVAQVPVQLQTKSIRSPSVKASSRHSKAKQLQKSIKLSEKLNQNEPEKSIKQAPSQVKQQVSHKDDKISQKSLPISKHSAIDESRSKKSSKLIEEEVRSKKSNVQAQDAKSQKSASIHQSVKQQVKLQVKEDVESQKSASISPVKANSSHKSHRIIEDAEVLSKKSETIAKDEMEEIVSNKSKQPSIRQDVISKKSASIANEEIISQKSARPISVKQSEAPSNKSNRIDPEPNSPLSHKSIKVSEKASFSKKSAALVAEANNVARSPQEEPQVSILGSQISQQQAEFIPTNSELTPSVKSSSYPNQSQARESSRVMIDMNHNNNELKAQVQAAVPQYDMRKRKEDNQSQKKSRSFVIHSRNGSVKDKLSNSQISSPSRKSKDLSSAQESATKGEILKLHEQIALLQDKLRRVEERQEQMERMQGTLSKIHLLEEKEKEELPRSLKEVPVEVPKEQPNKEEPIEQAKIEQKKQEQKLPIPQQKVELAQFQIRPQPRLQIQSSILQVNTLEQVRKQQEKQHQNGQKTRLREEISRLKKIIRDMQIEKIRSIDLQAQDHTPQASRVEKDSISSMEGTQQRRFGSTNKRLLQDAGRIVHNSSGFQAETPKRKSISRLRLPEEDASDVGDLPPESNKRSNSKGKFYIEARRSDLAARIGQKQRDFHSFIESSRVIAEDTAKPEAEPAFNNANALKNFSKVAVVSQDVDYSRLVQEMRKPNPEEQQVLPQVHLRDLQMPVLPEGPNANMTQQELLSLARSTYLAFGVDVQSEGRQLCVKKYKNCVIFSLDGQNHQCILWHFSGKFYMGSWRAGEPGEGEKDGEGLELVPGKHLYKGQFLAGKRHGSGILKQVNGNIYDGQWADGVKSGRGVYLDAATRVLYSGEWRDGRKEGQGFLKLSQKQYYFGTFVKSIKEGFGVEVFVNGDKYRGQYRAGKFHGRGKYLWANGSCYQGQFHQGVRNGQGSWRSARTNPDIYIGSYEKDKKTGYGRYVWANGCMYEGGFANDLKHGKGRLTYQDGKEIKGTWQEGNLVATEVDKRIVEHEDQPLRRSVKVASFLPASAKRI